uniref:Uncharacterized protein n=1 Tax=Oryza sativa subsp. japonica TaxID=39947 RepID=Q6ZF13_ORYSJ|nr:hypothetical protein [Oryza sativa Japonica Group]BAD31641.1 hypothetical protein [Oryza sativa Japonica Group]
MARLCGGGAARRRGGTMQRGQPGWRRGATRRRDAERRGGEVAPCGEASRGGRAARSGQAARRPVEAQPGGPAAGWPGGAHLSGPSPSSSRSRRALNRRRAPLPRLPGHVAHVALAPAFPPPTSPSLPLAPAPEMAGIQISNPASLSSSTPHVGRRFPPLPATSELLLPYLSSTATPSLFFPISPSFPVPSNTLAPSPRSPPLLPPLRSPLAAASRRAEPRH